MAHWIDRLPWPIVQEMLRLMRVDKPIGTWLVLWPAMWSLFAAAKPQFPGLMMVFIFSCGSFIMRSAGCVMNDLADRDFDPHVKRTKNRPLAAGRISVLMAKRLLLSLMLVALFFAMQLNLFALQLCVVAAFLAVSYPFTKRFVHWPQFYLGAAFGWGGMVAWGAQTEQLSLIAWLLFLATLTWAAAYDTVYAMMDIADDRRIGVKSTAILFGSFALPMVALLYLCTLLLLVVAGVMLQASQLYYLVLIFAAAQMAWQLVISANGQYLRAFVSNKWLGGWIWIGFLLA
ncbi:MAG: 4-hydroxybenzoate octaprenyltransferase [Magnetococcales bacterium]|nr:4-hydroxybenzoate octaprenyltransferase [Magnetococcales bacterium]